MKNTAENKNAVAKNGKKEDITETVMLPPFISRFTNILLLFVFSMIVLLSYLIKYPDVTKETALLSIIDAPERKVNFRLKSAGNFSDVIKEGNEITFSFPDAETKKVIVLKGTVLKITVMHVNNEVIIESRIADEISPSGPHDKWGELEMRSVSRSLMDRLINNYFKKYLRGN